MRPRRTAPHYAARSNPGAMLNRLVVIISQRRLGTRRHELRELHGLEALGLPSFFHLILRHCIILHLYSSLQDTRCLNALS